MKTKHVMLESDKIYVAGHRGMAGELPLSAVCKGKALKISLHVRMQSLT